MTILGVTGIGTDVGKTIVSAILVKMLGADYWKPLQCGLERDSAVVQKLSGCAPAQIHPEAVHLAMPASPHLAAQAEGKSLSALAIFPPRTERLLVLETPGGLLVPLAEGKLCIDAIAPYVAEWVLVSAHYLGSINHTLLSLEALRLRGLKLRGIVFNGETHPENERVILARSEAPLLGRLKHEPDLTPEVIADYAYKWRERWDRV